MYKYIYICYHITLTCVENTFSVVPAFSSYSNRNALGRVMLDLTAAGWRWDICSKLSGSNKLCCTSSSLLRYYVLLLLCI